MIYFETNRLTHISFFQRYLIFIIFFYLPIHAENLRITNLEHAQCSPQEEICGNNIDEDCDGKDFSCREPDMDADGYNSTSDCDDNDSRIYPGEWAHCNSECGDGIKLCKDDGSFSSCSCDNILCEAASGSRCYYISATTGDDNNPGTFQQKLKTLGGFSDLSTTPKKIKLNSGDMVYLLDGIYKVGPSDGTPLISLVTRNLSPNKISFRAYPGTHPILSSSNSSELVLIANSSNLHFKDLELRYNSTGLLILNSSNITLEKIKFVSLNSTSQAVKCNSSSNINIILSNFHSELNLSPSLPEISAQSCNSLELNNTVLNK